MRRAALVVLIALAACEDTTPQYELENDRVIAVRATPPHVAPGGRATLDALVTAPGRGPFVAAPTLAAAVPTSQAEPLPPELAQTVAFDGTAWTVTCPDDAQLASARSQMALDPGAPVPLVVGLTFDVGTGPLPAIKRVMLGDARDNPVLGEVSVNGATAADGMMVPADVEVPLHAPTSADTDEVAWLTSIGELGDWDDPDATLLHDPAADPPSPTSGYLAVTLRDIEGGVAWAFWTIAVE